MLFSLQRLNFSTSVIYSSLRFTHPYSCPNAPVYVKQRSRIRELTDTAAWIGGDLLYRIFRQIDRFDRLFLNLYRYIIFYFIWWVYYKIYFFARKSIYNLSNLAIWRKSINLKVVYAIVLFVQMYELQPNNHVCPYCFLLL